MRKLPLEKQLPQVSDLVFGCMGLGGDWDPKSAITADHIKIAHQAVDAALAIGINLFDHADIYTSGKAEKVFAKILKQRPELQREIYIQSKCAIRFADEQYPGRYDTSPTWLNHSIDGILNRLQVEHIDVLLLHRPDPLMDAEEIAQTLKAIKASGKVSHFGVSNMHLHQIQLLNHYLDEPLLINQLEINLQKLDWLEEGVLAGNTQGSHVNFTSGTLEYCQMNNLQVQSWGSLCQGLFSGRDLSEQPESVVKTAQLVQSLAHKYQTTCESIILAWLMRHPARVQPVIGTTQAARIKACGAASEIMQQLTRDDWYSLYVTARGQALP
ncbi:aldo/keto reductase [Algibacillus agarilyticus]|uniref:aldo/keto reductase n=1 Tax=Algibacillus agarilyticus TaxID=2234133 RepID=UPI000DCFACFE|nr:aldo/keto reductase [Algibacillus agarilyticus]